VLAARHSTAGGQRRSGKGGFKGRTKSSGTGHKIASNELVISFNL
jgi:hypothetical protein